MSKEAVEVRLGSLGVARKDFGLRINFIYTAKPISLKGWDNNARGEALNGMWPLPLSPPHP